MEQLGISVKLMRLENDPKRGTTVYYYLSIGKGGSRRTPGSVGFVTNPEIHASLKKVMATRDFVRRCLHDPGKELGWVSVTSNLKEKTIKIERCYAPFLNDPALNFKKAGATFKVEEKVRGDLGNILRRHVLVVPKGKRRIPIPLAKDFVKRKVGDIKSKDKETRGRKFPGILRLRSAPRIRRTPR